VLSGTEIPDYGNVFIHGIDSTKRRINSQSYTGFVPFNSDLDPFLSLEENIRFIGSVYGVKDSNITSRIKKFATDLNFMDSLHKQASITSPGNAKKAMIVRELIHDPSILIIDEPTAFMDARSGRETYKFLRRLAGEKTIIYVSQSLPEVEQANDRIMVMQQGKIILDGTLDRLLESTLRYHQFEIEFVNLTKQLFNKLAAVTTVVNPTKIGNTLHFYGRERAVFFQVLHEAAGELMKDLSVKKLSLRDLLDSEFAGRGLD
jgi:ABC-2 type transport system ATP-binding protein